MLNLNQGFLRQRRLQLNDLVKAPEREKQTSADANDFAANTPIQVGNSTGSFRLAINNN